VDLIVTSPPYFGLRSYQDGGEHYAGQLGSEPTPAEFVDALIECTREMVRVLKPSGSIWVNLGDRFSDGMHLEREGMTIEDAAWLAGVVDSDGSISVHINKQPDGRAPSFVPWVRVGQMKPEVVQQIAAVTGVGKAWQDSRGVWNWSAAAQQAATVLRWIWPWLRIKQRQGLAAVELARHIAEKRNRGTWSRVSDEDIAYRQSIRDAVLDWNGGRVNEYVPPRLPYPSLRSTRTWIPAKSLVGVPWRYALRCIDDLGLILRAEVIWSKANPIPESVTDRVRRSHETWFHLVKSPRYFSAADQVREPHTGTTHLQSPRMMSSGNGLTHRVGGTDGAALNPLGKLPGSVWEIATQPLKVPAELGINHFAAFPLELPRRVIRGWSPSGICTACGEGRRPAITRGESSWERRKADGDPMRYGMNTAAPLHRSLSDAADRAAGGFGRPAERLVTGEACACPDATAPTQPSVVLDPFGGTGTTALVADVLGRHGISVDMSADYCRLATWRCNDPGERARAMQVEKPPAVIEGQLDLFGEVSA
jgi:DNA modification methylase